MTFNMSVPRAVAVLGIMIGSQAAHALDLGGVTNTEASLYGYVKLDMMYDMGDVDGGSDGLGDSIRFSNIAVEGQDSRSRFSSLTANESRLGLKTVTGTAEGDLTTVVEGDFWGGDFRLRQAYGRWNGITAGQTWSNFHTFVGTTETLDFTGPLGRDSVLRQSQLRYSTGGLHIALEDPDGVPSGKSFTGGYDGTVNGQSIAGVDVDRKNSLPDLSVRYESRYGAGRFSTAAVVREVGFDDGSNSDSEIGWGAFIAGSYPLTSSLVVRAQLTGGEGIGGYMKGNPAPAAYRIGNTLHSLTAWGGTLGATLDVGPGAFNLAYSYTHTDWDDAIDDGLTVVNEDAADDFVNAYDETYQLVHLNYLWQPTKQITYGVEIAHARRETVDGRDGAITRLQGSAIYKF